jgi:septal ring factor EnvC (AmiA/AmiB activator)
MTTRSLTFWNAFGCLLLAAVVVMQWRREHRLDEQLRGAQTELAATRDQLADATEKRIGLERDIKLLKESLESAQQALEASVKESATHKEQADRVSEEVSEVRQQVAIWEDAIKRRDEKIQDLDGQLIATRQRLDEAVKRLKAGSQ